MKFILSAVVMTLSLCTNPVKAAPTRYSSFLSSEVNPALPNLSFSSIPYFTGVVKNNRVLLTWAIDNNIETDRIEVERSHDGKNFSMVALVFGSEQAGVAEYQFYEKLRKGKSFYRLKIIHKNNTIDYSATITPGN